jgi:nucleoside-diphosphate-sugar epimerase
MISLVTGGTGFIGTNLVSRLIANGDQVRVLSRRTTKIPGATTCLIDFAKPDLSLDDSVFAGVDVVYHLAGSTRAPSAHAFDHANVTSTHRLIDRIRSTTARPRFIYVSSQAAAGPTPVDKRDGLTESDPPLPVDAYGRSKLLGEQTVKEQCGDVPWTIVRPSAVYGPGDRDFLPIFSMAKRGVAVYPGTKSAILSTIFVDDLATGLIAAARSSAAIRNTYFLAADPPVAWSDIYHSVADVMGRSFRLQLDVPMPLMQLGGAIGDLFGRLTGTIPLLNSDKVSLAAPRSWICSSEAAHRDFGFSPSTSLRDGLSHTYKWYLEQGWL